MANYDCTKCGACCKFAGRVELSKRDAIRFWNLGLLNLCEPYADGHGLKLKTTKTGRCIALRGRIRGNVHCAIYRYRPGGCRTFKPGCVSCGLSRAEIGLST